MTQDSEELLRRRLKKAWHEATFLQGQTTPAAKHLFDAIDNALRSIPRGNQ